MQTIDWVIVGTILLITCSIGGYASRYTRSVADFLSAGRCARRYLIAIAEAEAGNTGFGAVHMIAYFEMFYQAGFTAAWWPLLRAPTYLIIGVTGWVLYRYRQTRAMTMAQFFEARYSRNFRIFAGLLSFVCGIMFFAIFPSVAGRFFVYFCGLPASVEILSCPVATHLLVTVFILGISMLFTYMGGQLTVLVTDFVQGFFINISIIIVLFCIFRMFTWQDISTALAMAPEQQSMVNAFKSTDNRDFNFWYFLISVYISFYTTMAWQGGQGYNSSAISPHEARIGKMLGSVRCWAQYVMMFMLPIACYTLMRLPSHAETAAQITETLNGISDPHISRQMTVPVAARYLLPTGALGLMCAILLSSFIGCIDSYMHSYGSIFVQDVIMPFRKKPFTPEQHLKVLKWSIVGVTVVVFAGSLFFTQTQYLFMYMAIVGAIYLGGAGAVIIGGLYWKRGTTAAAWCSLILGASMSLFAIAMDHLWPMWFHGKKFPINGQYMTFITMISCALTYITVSLASKKPPFDLDALLHRNSANTTAEKSKRSIKWLERLGITSEFTRGERWLVVLMTSWSVGWCAASVIVMIYYAFFGISHDGWMKYWLIYTGMAAFLGTLATIWFAVGGIGDMLFLFRTLAVRIRDDKDNGTVDHSQTETPGKGSGK